MGCQQSLCAGPSATDEYDDDQSHEWDGLEDGERRALRAHRRRCAEPVRSLSTTSLAAQGPSIYRADIGPLTRLPRGFDPFAMACKLIKKGKASDYSSPTRTGRANSSRSGGQAGVDEIFDVEQVLVRRFGLGTLPDKSRMPKKKTKKIYQKRDLRIILKSL